ncbi:alpha/beta fold hydrolase [Jeotgalibaca caeni]|uniref:alpha/beta fold hydrolase n=1 Tax=Jeotgalibaca caeni TaxID=3028623 RepID=UPI00237E902C|nr:alpha/beta hydrolase [Jeotgalibaca caeni]MDE1549906.1 alpha/beta hydrolase [Jeotgalibaca caeni]
MKKWIKGKHGASIMIQDIGEGQPIVFLHGWPFANDMFEYQYNHFLPRGYRVIGIDMRGFGGSDLVIEEYGYDTFADDVKMILDTLAVEDVILVGFSMGAAVAARYMARHDGWGVRKLIFISAAVPTFTKHKSFMTGIKKAELITIIEQIQTNRPKMIQDFMKKLFHEKAYTSYKDWLTNMALDASSYATILTALMLREEDVSQDLAKIQVPVLICHGEKDQVCSFELTYQMAERIPQNIVIPFKKSGHAIFHDELEKLNRTMLLFMQK